MRLDVHLKEKGFFESREKARAAIAARAVLVNDREARKASQKVSENDKIELLDFEESRYVSRSALKLKHAIDTWKINFKDKVVLDIGASTGGFSQVALEAGAKRVFAVDVGYGQLHEKIKEDLRIVNMENCDARKLKLSEQVDTIVMDVSFISAFKILPQVTKFLKKDGELILLFKPQFELGKENVKKGIADKEKIPEALKDTKQQKLKKLGFSKIKSSASPVKGKDGNQEYLLYAKLGK